MSDEHKQSYFRRLRIWLGVIAFAVLLLVAYVLLPHFGIGRGITEANAHRIVAGMTRTQVEAVLGAPNSLSDLARKNEAFWDKNTLLGMRYVSIHVKYDLEGNVVNARVNSFWRQR